MRKRLVGLGVGLLALIPLCAQAAPVLIDGRLWAQPIDFLNLSWNEISTACDPTTGACNGTLNGHDVTGMTWATTAEVGALFESLGVTGFSSTDPNDVTQANSPWAPYILSLFTPTQDASPDLQLVAGINRNTQGSFALSGSVLDQFSPSLNDGAFTSSLYNVGIPAPLVGAWLYASIPTPAPESLLLMALGGLGLGLARGRRKTGSENDQF